MSSIVLSTLLAGVATQVASAQTVVVIDQRESVSPETITLPIEVPPFSIEHQVRLSLEGRIDWPTLGGSNPWIIVRVNGNMLVADSLLNKPNTVTMRNGDDLTWFNDRRWRIVYAPDFEAAVTDTQAPYGMEAKDEPYRLVWDITQHVRPGRNELRLEHVQVLDQPDTLVLRNVAIEVGQPIEAPGGEGAERAQPAPEGPLDTFVAQDVPAPPLMAAAHDGTIFLRVGDQRIVVRTRLSLPGGGWREARTTGGTTWSAGPCRVSRKLTVQGDHVTVADTFTNTTDQLVGLMVEHHAAKPAPTEAVYLAGRRAYGETGNANNSAHPSAFAQFQQIGVGLVAEDDVFRVHVRSFQDPKAFGLADDRLGLPPKTSVTLEWSIYPSLRGDYWTFVNAVRRNWGVNFTIPGPFSFSGRLPEGLTGEQYAKWMHDRGLKYVCGGIAQYPDNKVAMGTDILNAPEFVARQREWSTRMAATDPELVPIAYFHAQICTEPGSRSKYADARLLDAHGKQIDYPYGEEWPLFVPAVENSYGRAVWKFVDCLISDVGAKGIYWDEMSYSAEQFAPVAAQGAGLSWDGHTVAIDSATHEITGKLSSVPLLTQPLALRIVRYIQGKGLFFMANSQAHTRTMMRQKLVRFVETGSYSLLSDAHLGCPLGLGNHLTEDTQAESARHVREQLKRGALYYGHYYTRDPAPWNFTSVMFPITPEQIGPGYVLGKERIHTTVSGRFGFPDGAAAEVTVVNGEGERVETGMVTEVQEKGKRRYEIRMPSDHFAILVRTRG